MDRQGVSSSFSMRLPEFGLGFAERFSTPDGRWSFVSGSMMALVAGSIAWLAMGTLPPGTNRYTTSNSHALLPYQLFLKLTQGAADHARAIAANTPAPDENATPSGIENRTVTLDSGDTLAGTLTDAGISQADAAAAMTALRTAYDPRGLKAGQSLDLTYSSADSKIDATGNAKTTIVMVNHKPVVVPIDSNAYSGTAPAAPSTAAPATRLLSVHFSPSIGQDVTVTRALNGGFTAQSAQKTLEAHVHRAGATIDSSLYLAAMQAGIPADIVVQMIHMFSYKVDFQRDLHPGDSFEVFYNYYYTPQGQPAKEGDISYAKMTLGGKDIVLYRYQDSPDDPPDYFDAKGQSAKGMLMKTPVDGARITSGFGMRFHPILGYTRMHKGIDFGVPIGTPVMAAGAGTVEFMGVENGYGNFVLLNHGNGYETAYGHLSRFAPGMHRGSRVRQGQVFAYSGMSGMATGPHLHYEIRINHQQVNPTTVKIAQGRILTGRDRQKFLDQRLKTDALIASTRLETKVADISTDLRQAKVR
jgi:murein DD-endopeptidase MepM/ murein hydrolase activator NlpD